MNQQKVDKIKNFLLHGVSEIFFVLVGILLALQINNWNSKRKEIETRNLQLLNLKEELIEEQKTLAHLKMIHEFKYEGFQYLLTLIGEPKYDPTIDDMTPPILKDNLIWPKEIPTNYNKAFIHKVFLWSHRVDFFKSNQTTLNEMNNAGTLSLIKNRDLKIGILGYYDSWDGRLRILMRELVEDWQKSFEKDGLITSIVHREDNPLELFKNNPERIGKLYRLARECVWWHNSTIVLSEMSGELIVLIDKEIEGK